MSINIYADNKDQKPYQIGYTTKHSQGQYNSGYYVNNSDQSDIYYAGPKRSPERPLSGNWREDFADWCRMNDVPILGRLLGYDEDWPSYVERDYWEQFLKEHPEYYDEVWNYYQTHPEKPNNPFAPVGDMPWILGGMFIIACIIRQRYKNDTIAQW